MVNKKTVKLRLHFKWNRNNDEKKTVDVEVPVEFWNFWNANEYELYFVEILEL